MGGKFGDAMKAAKAVRENDDAVKDSLQQSVITDLPSVDDSPVSITVKVPRYLREHWQIESRKARTTVTAEIVEFLTKRFGTPD
jgi:hypothetical protein